MIVVHIAGPMLEGVQRCVRCNAILIDYRNTAIAVAPRGVPVLRGWADGAYVYQEGNGSTARMRDACGVHERNCSETVQ